MKNNYDFSFYQIYEMLGSVEKRIHIRITYELDVYLCPHVYENVYFFFKNTVYILPYG